MSLTNTLLHNPPLSRYLLKYSISVIVDVTKTDFYCHLGRFSPISFTHSGVYLWVSNKSRCQLRRRATTILRLRKMERLFFRKGITGKQNTKVSEQENLSILLPILRNTKPLLILHNTKALCNGLPFLLFTKKFITLI